MSLTIPCAPDLYDEAFGIVRDLSSAGHLALFAGGCVRDSLLGRPVHDIDIATSAHPDQVEELFRGHTIPVGKSFGVVVVKTPHHTFEVATFRADGAYTDGRRPDSIRYANAEADAQRRDFTINGLFYDIKTYDVIDYVGGLADLEKGILRSIGDPNIRFREDPVRMMRAIRLSSKLGMTIERGTLKAISRHHSEISKAAVARVLEEIFRLFSFSASEQSFRLMWSTGLLSDLLPILNGYIDSHGGKKCAVWSYLREFDKATAGMGEDATNGLRIAALYLAPYLDALAKKAEEGREPNRGDRIRTAEEVLRVVGSQYKMPKAAYYHAVHLLEELACFEKNPPRDRTIRASRAAQFADAVMLARIRAAVDGLPTHTIDAWAKLKVIAAPRHPSDADGDETRDVVPDSPRDDTDAPRHERGEREERSFRSRPRRRRFRPRRPFGDAKPSSDAASQ